MCPFEFNDNAIIINLFNLSFNFILQEDQMEMSQGTKSRYFYESMEKMLKLLEFLMHQDALKIQKD